MSIELHHMDNMDFELEGGRKANYIIADHIYENLDFHKWIVKYWDMLEQNGIFCVITDWHSRSEIDTFLRYNFSTNATFVNSLVWKNEWGRPPSKNFHQCYDDILIYCKGDEWPFHSEKIQVPKATAKSKGLNPSGRTTKNATCWIGDCTLTTSSKERIKDPTTGKLIKWQKPLSLFRRIMLPFLSPGDLVIDPFMGTAPAGVICAENNFDYIGIEYDKTPYDLSVKRING